MRSCSLRGFECTKEGTCPRALVMTTARTHHVGTHEEGARTRQHEHEASAQVAAPPRELAPGGEASAGKKNKKRKRRKGKSWGSLGWGGGGRATRPPKGRAHKSKNAIYGMSARADSSFMKGHAAAPVCYHGGSNQERSCMPAARTHLLCLGGSVCLSGSFVAGTSRPKYFFSVCLSAISQCRKWEGGHA
jgi:hypothetical protein